MLYLRAWPPDRDGIILKIVSSRVLAVLFTKLASMQVLPARISDGTKAWGGCAYCSQEGSLWPNQDPNLAIKEQIEKGMSFVTRRYGANQYIVYFQSFTNTYDKPEVLRERFESAFVDPRIVGLSIATRPDCILPENIEVLREFKKKSKYFSVELGLQTKHQNTLDWVNRQETHEDYIRAMKLLREAEIPVISHLILGFPGEGIPEVLETLKLAEEHGSAGVKLQMLHIIKNTKLALLFKRDPFKLYSMEEYGEAIIHLVERLSPKIEIHRITGETEKEQLVAPNWVANKTPFFTWFENELEDATLGRGSITKAKTIRSNSLPSQLRNLLAVKIVF